MQNFSLDIAQLNRLFPFFFLINKKGEIVSSGHSLEKIVAIRKNQQFDSVFKIKSPFTGSFDLPAIVSELQAVFSIEVQTVQGQVLLSGQFEHFAETSHLLFVGTPCFDSIKDLEQTKLSQQDFAVHDPSVRLLQSKEIAEANNELVLAQLKEERKEFRYLALIAEETLNSGIITDAEGKIQWVNKAFERITGYTLNEMRGKSPGSVLQGKDTDPITVAYLRRQIRAGEKFDCEILNYRKGGKPYWVKISGQPIFDDVGKLVQFFALEEDITEKKESAEKIRQSEEQWQFAFEGGGEGVWEYNFETKISYISSKLEKMLGYEVGELDKYTSIMFRHIHPDDLPAVIELENKYLQGVISNHKIEYRIQCKDGHYIWILDWGMLISKTADGKPLGLIGTHSDITELKRIEISLEQSEKQFRTLSENMPGVVYEFEFYKNGGYGFKFISPSIEKIFGLTSSDFTDFTKYVHPDDLERLTNSLKETEATNNPFYYEGRLLINGRGVIWHSASSSFSYTDYNGSRIFTGILIDITEKKLSETRLEEQRKFYEQVLNHIPSDIAVFDNTHTYLFLNPVAIKNPELRQWMIGKKDEDYCRHRNRPPEVLEGRRATFNKVIQSKKLVSWEEALINNEGEKEYHLRHMYPVLDADGEVNIVIGYGVNISEVKRIEEQMRINEKRYRDLFNYSQALICTHDQNGILLSVNPAICESLGYSRDELVGRPLRQFMPAKESEMLQKDYLDVVLRDGKSKGVFRIIDRQGRKLFLLFQNYMVEEKGVEPYVIGFAQDITERVQAENELLLAKQLTENVSKAKEIFLANMSHEIRTPMNGILGIVNLLSKTGMNEQQKNYLYLIKESANNLMVIVNDVLDIEKIGSGKFEFEQIPFRFAEKTVTSIQSFRYKAEEKGLQLIFSSFLNNDLVVIGDPYRLSQILNNLLNNAIKFTAEGRIVVEIREVSRDADKINIGFSVTDTGIGIDKSKHDSIFEPFMQASTDTTRKFGGTGLGLSICKNLVELMGGHISLKSSLNMGTTFYFEIPYTIGHMEMLVKEEKAPDDYNQIGNKKILVAEDVELNQFIARQIMEPWGIEVSIAVNGKEAVEKVKTTAYDLILMDIQMPEMDGIEATEIIRKMDDASIANIPIIALTANALKGDNHRYFQAGMNDYITKPYTEEKLYAVISKYLLTSKKQPSRAVPVFEHPKVSIAIPEPNATVLIENVKPPSGIADEALLYDLTMVNTIGKGNEGFAKKMISLFLAQMPGDISKLNLSAQKGEWEAVSKLAHKMKPSIDGMGIGSLKETVREIETGARSGEAFNETELLRLISEYTSTMEKVLIQLRNAYPEIM